MMSWFLYTVSWFKTIIWLLSTAGVSDNKDATMVKQTDSASAIGDHQKSACRGLVRVLLLALLILANVPRPSVCALLSHFAQPLNVITRQNEICRLSKTHSRTHNESKIKLSCFLSFESRAYRIRWNSIWFLPQASQELKKLTFTPRSGLQNQVAHSLGTVLYVKRWTISKLVEEPGNNGPDCWEYPCAQDGTHGHQSWHYRTVI